MLDLLRNQIPGYDIEEGRRHVPYLRMLHFAHTTRDPLITSFTI